MAGVEAAETPEPSPHPAFELFGSITLEAESREFTLSLDLDCGRELARALAASMLGTDDAEMDEDTLTSSIREILNVVAGRIKNSCSERKIDTALGLPVLESSRGTAHREPEHHWQRWFCWQQVHLFRLGFRATTGTAVTAS